MILKLINLKHKDSVYIENSVLKLDFCQLELEEYLILEFIIGLTSTLLQILCLKFHNPGHPNHRLRHSIVKYKAVGTLFDARLDLLLS